MKAIPIKIFTSLVGRRCCAAQKIRAERHLCPTRKWRSAGAFTLIEVMVAVTIFFMAMFAILGVLSSGIHAASILRSSGPTPGMAAGYFWVTNKIEEGEDSGDFSDIAGYDGYQWRSYTDPITNGLYRMDFVVIDPTGKPGPVLKSVLLYKPQSRSNQRMGLQR